MNLQQKILHKLLFVNDGRLDHLTLNEIYQAISVGLESANQTALSKNIVPMMIENLIIESVIGGIMAYYE